MAGTFAEKLLSLKAGKRLKTGDIAVVDVDVTIASDTTAPLAIKAFQKLTNGMVHNPERTFFFIDHATPCPNQRIANIHKFIREFAISQGIHLFDDNNGVCHQVMFENSFVKQGDLVFGADSHTCSYGAVGAFATGIGSTDLAGILYTGETWVKVPESIQINLIGKLRSGVYAKDVALRIIGDLSSSGANYMSIEYSGDGFASFSSDEAFTVCNMAVETGAKSGVFTSRISREEIKPEIDADYAKRLDYKAETIEPMIACPDSPDAVLTVRELSGKKIDIVFFGSCTNARLTDIEIVASILKNKTIASGTRMLICPSSRKVLREAIDKGFIQQLIDAGAVIEPPGCSLCVGTLGGIPADGDVVLSTSNRNFRGRMGNNKSPIYLGSPATAAAAALTGMIVDPREVI